MMYDAIFIVLKITELHIIIIVVIKNAVWN